MPLTVPELSLVLLVGTSGAGKSTFAARHFRPTEILSSDRFRGVVADDETDQSATGDAFATMAFIAERRLARGLLTVVDATNLYPEDRKRWVTLARQHDVLPVALVLDVPPVVAVARNAQRPDRPFGEGVVRRQATALRRSLRNLDKEGFRRVHVLRGVEAIDGAVLQRERAWTDRRDERGPFDIIGDIHGCVEELDALLAELGWTLTCEGEGDDAVWKATHSEARRLIFLGDLVDRGPGSDRVLHRVMDLVADGTAICVPGNHEAKLEKWLRGKPVKPSHGLQETIDQLSARSQAFRDRVARFLDGLISHFVLDEGRLVVAHAGMTERYAGRASGRVRAFALYGQTTGETDEYGLPVRYPWADEYTGTAAVVYGHTPVPRAVWHNNTLCLDTGCVFGGELSALRWPERELIGVPAVRTWYEPVRPLEAPPPRPDAFDPSALLEGFRVETRHGPSVTLRAEHVAPAMETLTRFALHPRWLIHLPPTMAPVETSDRPDRLEHPDQAFAYYRKVGVRTVVCEEKHMGSRAMVLVGREDGALDARFGAGAGAGRIISRRGRRFFDDEALERALLERVRAAIGRAGLWDRLESPWMLLDAELMPWSAKARDLLRTQYAPVGAAGLHGLEAATAALERAAARSEVPTGDARSADPSALLERFQRRQDHLRAYDASWRRYVWPVAGVDDLRLAPFHLLASEGRVHTDQTHVWHMQTLAELATDPVLVATPWRAVDLDDEAAVAAATAWWTGLTEAGGEGMVVKPLDYLTRHRGRLVQPALKVRGREYLRIIYGPEYTDPEQLARLRARGVQRKRRLAEQELVLGLEALERFVAGEDHRRTFACILGLMALEAEPVDPRL